MGGDAFFEASHSGLSGALERTEQDMFVISEDVVDAFVARKKDGVEGAEAKLSSSMQELRGAILSLLMHSDDGNVSNRSSTFFEAADMAIGSLSRAVDPPPLGSTRSPVVAVPVVSLVRKLYAPAADLYQSKAHGDCRAGNSSVQEDMHLLLSELDSAAMRSQADVQARARRWELLRRFSLPPGTQRRVEVPGTHADVLMLCGSDTLRVVRLQGPASGSTPAAGRLLFAGDDVAVDGTKMALLDRRSALDISRRGYVNLAKVQDKDSLQIAIYDSPEAAASAMPPASKQLANARVRSSTEAALALGRRVMRVQDTEGLVDLISTTISADSDSKTVNVPVPVKSDAAALATPWLPAIVAVLKDIEAIGGDVSKTSKADADAPGRRLAQIQVEIDRLVASGKGGNEGDCDLEPLGNSRRGIQGWMRMAADAGDEADDAQVSCAQGHLSVGDAVLSRSGDRLYAFDHIRAAKSTELCLTRMRLRMLRADADMLRRPVPGLEDGAAARVTGPSTLDKCAAWMRRVPIHPEVVVQKSMLSGTEFEDDIGSVLAISDNSSYSSGPAESTTTALAGTSHRVERAGILRDLEKLLGISPPLALTESAMLLDLMSVLIPPGDGKAATALRNSIEEVRRRRAELVARYRHRKQPYRVIEAELIRSLRERAAPRILVEEVSSMSALLAAFLASGDRSRIASGPSSALAAACGTTRGSRSRSKTSSTIIIPVDKLVNCAANAVLSGRIAPDRMPSSADVSQAIATASAEVRRAGLNDQARFRGDTQQGDGSYRIVWDGFLPAPGTYRSNRTLSDTEAQLKETYVTIRLPNGRSSQPARSCCPYPVTDERWSSSRNYVQPSPSSLPSDLQTRHMDIFAGPAVAGSRETGLQPVSPPAAHVIPVLIDKDIGKGTDKNSKSLDAILSALEPAAKSAFIGAPPGRDPAGVLRITSKARLIDAIGDIEDDYGTQEFAEMVWSSSSSVDVSGIAQSFLKHTLTPALGRANASLANLNETTTATDELVVPVVEALRSSNDAAQTASVRALFGQGYNVCSVVARDGDDAACLDAAIFVISLLRSSKRPYLLRASASVLSMLIEHVKFNRRDRSAAEAIALQAKREQLRRQAAVAADKMSEEQKDLVKELKRLGLVPPPESVITVGDEMAPDVMDDLDKLGEEPALPKQSVDASGVFEF